MERDAHYLAWFLAPVMNADDPPDAIVTASDYCAAVARKALGYALPAGRPLPPVTGYDNTWVHLHTLNLTECPPAVTVDKDFQAVGKALVHSLRDRPHGRKESAADHHTVVPKLIEPVPAEGSGQTADPRSLTV